MTEHGEAIYQYVYDKLNHLTKKINPLGAETSYTYDKHDIVTGRTDAKGNTTAYEVDLNGLVKSQTNPDGGVYAPAVIVDVKEHSAPSGEIQSGIPFMRENEAVDTGKTGPIIEWYTYEIDKNGGNINENLNTFNRNASIIIYRDEVMK